MDNLDNNLDDPEIVDIQNVSIVQSSIDKLTMELMMNKSHYKKYLLKQDPKKYQEIQEHIDKIHKYNGQIEELFSELLVNSMKSNMPEKYTRSINDAFQEFIKTCIQHFEICQLEQGPDNADNDTLFSSITQSNITQPISSLSKPMPSLSTSCSSIDENTSSNWGKPIAKSSNKPSYYTMDMYMNKK
jgi:hypothetical protein